MTAPAFLAAGVVIVGCLTGFGVLVGKTFAALDREPDAPDSPPPLDEFLASRRAHAADVVYDGLSELESTLLDINDPYWLAVSDARDVVRKWGEQVRM